MFVFGFPVTIIDGGIGIKQMDVRLATSEWNDIDDTITRSKEQIVDYYAGMKPNTNIPF